jgi:hypothetical protein
LAGFFRISSILPLVADAGKQEHDCMFDVYCSGHRGCVLLGPDNIECAVNRNGGVDLYWRCSCGTTGVRQFVPRRRVC